MLERLLGYWRHKRRGAGRGGEGPVRHVVAAAEPAVIYAVGDVHGCFDLLRDMEARIVADAGRFAGERWMLLLGDFVDRGPQSAQVVDHLLSPPPPGLRRLCLMGNHERMMLDFLRRPRAESGWLGFGGEETLRSYGVPPELLMSGTWNNRTALRAVESYIPEDHIRFLDHLPLLIETPASLFVHAGLRPGLEARRQREADLLWYRDEFTESFAGFGKTIVHGHAMREVPLVTPSRIAVDTGAYMTGTLTAVRLAPGLPPELLVAGRVPDPAVPPT